MDDGHSFSPTLEMRALPEPLHGEAVSIDIALSTVLSLRRGLLAETEARRILAVLRGLDLPVKSPALPTGSARRGAGGDDPAPGRTPATSAATGIGTATFVNDVTLDELRGAADTLLERALSV